MEAKIIQVGNSRGIRLPRRILLKYGFDDRVVLRETEDGVLIEKAGETAGHRTPYQKVA